jgi:hypothetical protein
MHPNLVLSVTLSDGNNRKYLVKLPQGDKNLDGASKEAVAKESGRGTILLAAA